MVAEQPSAAAGRHDSRGVGSARAGHSRARKEETLMLDIVIVGAGPVGLMLGCELALAGVRPLVLERLPERQSAPKANGLVGQVVRLLDHRGLYERCGGRGPAPQPLAEFFFGAISLPLSKLDANPVFALLVLQREV